MNTINNYYISVNQQILIIYFYHNTLFIFVGLVNKAFNMYVLIQLYNVNVSINFNVDSF